MSADYKRIITIEPGKRSGQPCIRGMRITVYDVLEYLAGGMSVEEVLHDFPELILALRIRRLPKHRIKSHRGMTYSQNLSRRQLLQDLYPDSLHIQDIGLDSTPDIDVWGHAGSENLVIVTKDFDFVELRAIRTSSEGHSVEPWQCPTASCFLASR